jgi:hypothetical protein
MHIIFPEKDMYKQFSLLILLGVWIDMQLKSDFYGLREKIDQERKKEKERKRNRMCR